MKLGEIDSGIKALIGLTAEWTVPDEVEKGAIRQWCEVFEDGNPVYTDDAVAKQMGYRTVISPTAKILGWVRQPMWPPAPLSWPAKAGTHLIETAPLGTKFEAGVVQSWDLEWLGPLYPGDLITEKETITDISPLKRTRLGVGHFATVAREFRNQDGDVVQKLTVVFFKYVSEEQAKAEGVEI